MLPEDIREKCEELADEVAAHFGLDEESRDETYDLLLKVCEGEIT